MNLIPNIKFTGINILNATKNKAKIIAQNISQKLQHPPLLKSRIFFTVKALKWVRYVIFIKGLEKSYPIN